MSEDNKTENTTNKPSWADILVATMVCLLTTIPFLNMISRTNMKVGFVIGQMLIYTLILKLVVKRR